MTRPAPAATCRRMRWGMVIAVILIDRTRAKRRIRGFNTKVLWRTRVLRRKFALMCKPSGEASAGRDSTPPLLAWSECDLFCIRDYAGTGAAPCGWRGRRRDARSDETGRQLCPRCGGATLLCLSTL